MVWLEKRKRKRCSQKKDKKRQTKKKNKTVCNQRDKGLLVLLHIPALYLTLILYIIKKKEKKEDA